MKRTTVLAALASLIGFGLSARPAQAGYLVTLLQQGTDVVATGSGTIDLTGLSSSGTSVDRGFVRPSTGDIVTGPSTGLFGVDVYAGFTGPTSFGIGTGAIPNSGSGGLVGVETTIGGRLMDLPPGYVSGNPLSDTSTYSNQNFASLGVTPGTYVWTWGTGAHADSFTLQVGPAVPEPASLTLLGIFMVGFLGYRRRCRRLAA
jgi:hypothetical protein